MVREYLLYECFVECETAHSQDCKKFSCCIFSSDEDMCCRLVSSLRLAPGSGLRGAASGYEAWQSGSFLTASLEGPHGPVAAGAPLGGEPPQSAATLGPSHLCSEKSSVDLDVWPRKGGCFSGKEGDTGKMGAAVTYSSYCLLKSSKPLICGMGGRWMLRMFLRREGPADDGWDVGSAARAKSKDADLS